MRTCGFQQGATMPVGHCSPSLFELTTPARPRFETLPSAPRSPSHTSSKSCLRSKAQELFVLNEVWGAGMYSLANPPTFAFRRSSRQLMGPSHSEISANLTPTGHVTMRANVSCSLFGMQPVMRCANISTATPSTQSLIWHQGMHPGRQSPNDSTSIGSSPDSISRRSAASSLEKATRPSPLGWSNSSRAA